MTEQEKELLLKDLCARLPYGLKVKIKEEGVLSYDSGIGVIVGKEHVDNEIFTLQCKNDSWCLTAISEFVPYLRPMSSMTDEERIELSMLTDDKFKFYLYTRKPEIICYEKYNYLEGLKVIDWLNKHQFDYRGLIPMGLAIKAPDGMYNIEN